MIEHDACLRVRDPICPELSRSGPDLSCAFAFGTRSVLSFRDEADPAILGYTLSHIKNAQPRGCMV